MHDDEDEEDHEEDEDRDDDDDNHDHELMMIMMMMAIMATAATMGMFLVFNLFLQLPRAARIRSKHTCGSQGRKTSGRSTSKYTMKGLRHLRSSTTVGFGKMS